MTWLVIYLVVLFLLLGFINIRKKPLDPFERVVLSAASVFWPATVPYLLISALVVALFDWRNKKS